MLVLATETRFYVNVITPRYDHCTKKIGKSFRHSISGDRLTSEGVETPGLPAEFFLSQSHRVQARLQNLFALPEPEKSERNFRT